VDVRIIAATNRDLLQAVRDGKFREDLFYRLSVFPIHLPPLRERASDLPLLNKFLINKFASRVGKRIEGITPETLRRFQAYPWPGNVRELENILERAVILASTPLLEIDPAPMSRAAPQQPEAFGLEAVERSHILSVLNQTNWIIEGARGAAKILDLHPNTLRSRMKKLGITRSTHEVS
jgi:transcriptional regulator with GAF, ATPase, and Fis domain